MAIAPKTSPDEKLYKKALYYAILFDLTHGALHNLGTTHAADQAKATTIVYDELTTSIKEK